MYDDGWMAALGRQVKTVQPRKADNIGICPVFLQHIY